MAKFCSQPYKRNIAVIGMACRFPGAMDYSAFWQNLKQGINSVREITPDRWDVGLYYSPDINEPNRSISKWCGLIEDIDKFDNSFFNISPREANSMDPQQRLLLQETWRCIEDSGLPLKKLQKKKTSVYVGVMGVDYQRKTFGPDVITDSYSCLGNYESILANRISYSFGFQGTSASINGACASSLIALHEAKQALLCEECDYAVAAGVNLNIHPWKYISFSKSRMLSPDGRCKTFDKSANGYVPGDGVGVLLLQRSDEAVEEKNRIYGLVKGSAVNHVGHSLSITSPRIMAQRDVILSAYEDAGFGADTVSYVEAHGTGTSLGDPIEVEALTQAFRKFTKKRRLCKIGSVKTNIGHLEGAAGIAGVIKVLLMIQYQKIPETLNVEELNPIIPFEGSPFEVATSFSDWHAAREDLPLRAGVSSFGFGGANAHALFESFDSERMYTACGANTGAGKRSESRHGIAFSKVKQSSEGEFGEKTVPKMALQEASAAYPPFLFCLSAKSESSLRNLIEQWKLFVDGRLFHEYELYDICATLMTGRVSFPYRHGCSVTSKQDIIRFLNRSPDVSKKPLSSEWFVRIGELSWDGFAQVEPLARQNRVWKSNLDMVEKSLDSLDKNPKMKAMFRKEQWPEQHRPLFSFLVGYAYVSSLLDLGFVPNLISGEKKGLWIALAASGIVRPEDIIEEFIHGNGRNVLQIRRPSIPFYDPVSRQIFASHRFDGEYVRSLSSRLDISNRLFLSIVRKARLLFSNQFTFKRYLEEWNPLFKKTWRTDIEQLIADDSPISAEGQRERRRRVILGIAILSSFRKLNQKWDLREERVKGSERLNELVDLVVDEVLPKETAVEIVCSHRPDFSRIAETLDTYRHRLNMKNRYVYLRKSNRSLREIRDIPQWLKQAGEANSIFDLSGTMMSVEIGALAEYSKSENSIRLRRLQCPEYQDIRTLFEVWLRGVDIRWDKLYVEGTFKKKGLPVYVFDKRSFWISHSGEKRTTGRDRASRPEGFNRDLNRPLRAVVDGEEVFTCAQEVSAHDPVFYDHVIAMKPLIPAAYMIGTALEKGREVLGQRINTVRSVTIQRPVVIERDTVLDVDIHPSTKRFFIRAHGLDVCRGEYGLQEHEPPPVKDISFYTKGEKRDFSDLYHRLARIGYRYGKSLRIVNQVWRRDATSVIELMIPQAEEQDDFLLNVKALDGVLQSVLALRHMDAKFPDDGTLYVPFGIRSLTLFEMLKGHCFVFIDEKDIQEHNLDLSVHMQVCDGSGRVVGRLEDIYFRRVGRSVLNPDDGNDSSGSLALHGVKLYRPVWVRKPVEEKDNDRSDSVAVLCVGESVFAKELHRAVDSTYQKVFLVQKGTPSHYKDDGCFKINPQKEEEYGKLLDTIGERIDSSVKTIHIYFLWSYDPKPFFLSREQKLKERIEEGVRSLFFLSRALIRLKRKQKIRIVVPTCNCHVVTSQDRGTGYVYGAVNGLASTVMVESPKIEIKTIDFETGGVSDSEKASLLVREGFFWEYPHIVAYRGDARSVRQIEETPFEDRDPKLFKEGAVYLLVGGAGGIGLKVAEMIARSVNARLVLVGRRRLKPENEQAVDRIRKYGSELLYLQGDMTDSGQVAAILDRVKNRYGGLNGLIHMAGILEDRLLMSKEWGSFQRVMAPKVLGVWILNEATKKEPLDFFIAFSSVVSIIGNAGQADYAAGNSFLDAFINYRAQNRYPGRSLCIDWTLWKDGGMGRKPEVAKSFMSRTGVIESHAALRAFSRLPAAGISQAILVKGWRSHRWMLHEKEKAMKEKTMNEELQAGSDKIIEGQPSCSSEGLKQTLIEFLVGILGIDKDELDEETDLRELGMDSVTLTEFAEMINERFNADFNSALLFEHTTIRDIWSYLSEAMSVGADDAGEETVETAPRIGDAGTDRPKPSDSTVVSSSVVSAQKRERDFGQDVAVIGMSGRFPGSKDPDEFWENLYNGRDCIREIPEERWSREKKAVSLHDGGEGSCSGWCGILDNVRMFDAEFFHISARETELMDPQQRLLLEEIWHTIEDAGYRSGVFSGTKTGVFIGVCNNDYWELMCRSGLQPDPYGSTGSYFSIIPNRISYFLDIHGPSVAIDTACSSSLVAIHEAIKAIRNGECPMAFVGGVNLCLSPGRHLSFENAGVLSGDGRCRPFDKEANGYIRGEGVGVLLLKPLEKAIEDGDYVHGIIKECAINHGGFSNSLTAPNPNAQAELLIEAYTKASIDPGMVGYVETHATGTRLGDPVEINGLKKAFEELFSLWKSKHSKRQYCGLGSVKGNIGHLESAAGIAGVIKVLLSMKHELLPASIHLKELNPYINLDESPFYVVGERKAWERSKDEAGRPLPRIAGVSSFGFGGTNAHVVLEEYTNPEEKMVKRGGPRIVVLSARNRKSLDASLRALLEFLKQRESEPQDSASLLADVSYTLQMARDEMQERFAAVVGDIDDLIEKLSLFLEHDACPHHVYLGKVVKGKRKSFSTKNGEDRQAMARSWVSKGECSKIAEEWVKGFPVDWSLLQLNKGCSRIPLPKYPFDRKEYWIPEESAPCRFESRERSGMSRFGLLIDRNSSTLYEQSYEKRLTGKESFLLDHTIGGHKVLPASLFTGFAFAAGELSLEKEVRRVENLVWSNPLVVDDFGKEIKVRLFPENGTVKYEIVGSDDKKEWRRHAHGSIVHESQDEKEKQDERVDLASIRKRCFREIENEEWYASFQSMGLRHGASFRTVQEALYNEKEALCRLKACAERRGELAGIPLAPALVDGGFQAAYFLMREARTRDFTLLLPFSLSEIELIRPLPEECYALVTTSQYPMIESDSANYHILFLDQEGRVAVRMKNFTLRMLEDSRAESVSFEPESLSFACSRPDEEVFLLETRRVVVKNACEVLNVNEKEIDLEDNTGEIIFDSAGITEFTDRINAQYDLDVTPAIYFEYPSLGLFTRFLLATHREKFVQYYCRRIEAARRSIELEAAAESCEESEPEGGYEPSGFGKRALSEEQRLSYEPIAVIGMSGVMPGSPDLEQFWKHLVEGDDLITEIPKDRWDWRDYYGDPVTGINKTDVKWGGFMEGVDRFDASFFGISPREAELMDPQQRIFLETAWKAVEDAGYRASDLSGTRTGVFVGVASSDYSDLLKSHVRDIEAHTSTGTAQSILANRVSFLLDLHGPSESIDTACSSSLVAIHRAVEALQSKNCEMAIAGGINVILNPRIFVAYSKAGMLSSDGRCRTFDENANGYVRGEGSGALVLKPLSRAVADRDHIYALIKATGVNHGGRASSLTTPNPHAQADLLTETYEKAQVDPGTVSYIEAHGTGTALGDPVEINGLIKAFEALYREKGRSFPDKPHCGIGAVKTSIGHLEAAAGISGMIKLLLCMRHKKLVANLHFNNLNPYIRLSKTPFYIVNRNRSWDCLKDEKGLPLPRRAGISSFGFGGVNAHVVLEEYTASVDHTHAEQTRPQLILLSARNEERIKAYAERLAELLEKREEWDRELKKDLTLENIAYTLHIGREEMEERLAVVASDLEELRTLLLDYSRGKRDRERLFRGGGSARDGESGDPPVEKAGDDSVTALIEKRELKRLARLWAAGKRIDPKLLYSGRTPRRVSLPSYPFARERYWLPELDRSLRSEKKRIANRERLHPLIDRNTSTFEHQRFTTLLTGDESYLIDHRVMGYRVVPATFYVEMARAAGEMAGQRRVEKMKDILWMKPIFFEEEAAAEEVHITLSQEQETADYEVVTNGEKGTEILHARGSLIYAENQKREETDEFIDIKGMKSRFATSIDGKDYYSLLRSWGLNYGPGFRVIQAVYTDETEALSRIELPSFPDEERENLVLNPALLDGALQTVMCLIGHEGSRSKNLFLPFSLDELEILKELPGRWYAHARLVENRHSGNQEVVKFDIRVFDENGRMFLKLKNFVLMRQDRENEEPQGERRKRVEAALQKLVLGELQEQEVEEYIGGIYG